MGEEGRVPLEIRFLHEPSAPEGFVGCALATTVFRFFKTQVLSTGATMTRRQRCTLLLYEDHHHIGLEYLKVKTAITTVLEQDQVSRLSEEEVLTSLCKRNLYDLYDTDQSLTSSLSSRMTAGMRRKS